MTTSHRTFRPSRRRTLRGEHRNRHTGWTLFFEAVGAIAAVIAVFQAYPWSSDSKQPPGPAARQELTAVNIDSLIPARERQLNEQIRPSEGYEVVYLVRQQKGIVDRETGFGFTAIEVSTVHPSWVGPSWADGVLSRYKLPNGEGGMQRRRAPGDRIDFIVNGRRFFAAIEDIDYKLKFVTIRIKEVLPHANRTPPGETPAAPQRDVTTSR